MVSKFFREFFFFLFLTALFYPVAVVLWGEFAPIRLHKNLNYYQGQSDHMHFRLREIDDLNDIDVLIIGSSTAYRGYDPRIFKNYNIRLFNLGSSAQTPIQTKYLVEKYVLQLNPELLIIDVNPLMFTIDGVESALDLVVNSNFDRNMIKMVIEINNLKVYNSVIYSFYLSFFTHNRDVSVQLSSDDIYISGGFVERKHYTYYHQTFVKKKWIFRDSQVEAFHKMIFWLAEHNINYVLVQAPGTKNFYESHINNSHFDSIMHKYGDYYNFNERVSLNDTLHFYDANHLNQKGVELFNMKILSDLFTDTIFLKSN